MDKALSETIIKSLILSKMSEHQQTPEANPQAMQPKSHLCKQPVEILEMIFEFVIKTPTLMITLEGGTRLVEADLGILWTCKILYEVGIWVLHRQMILQLRDVIIVGGRIKSKAVIRRAFELLPSILIERVRKLEMRLDAMKDQPTFVPDFAMLCGFDPRVFKSVCKVALLLTRTVHWPAHMEDDVMGHRDRVAEIYQEDWDMTGQLLLKRIFHQTLGERTTGRPVDLTLERRLVCTFHQQDEVDEAQFPSWEYAFCLDNHWLASTRVAVNHTTHKFETGEVESKRWIADEEVRNVYKNDPRAQGDWIISGWRPFD